MQQPTHRQSSHARRARISTAVLALILALVFGPAAPAAQAQGYQLVVNTPIDTVDLTPFDGYCADEYDQCSLRAAVMTANEMYPAQVTIVVPPGVYMLTIPNVTPEGENDALTGDLDVIGYVSIIGGGGDPSANPALTRIVAGIDTATGLPVDKVFSFNPYFDTPANNQIAALSIEGGYNRAGVSGPTGPGAGWGGGMDWDASGSGSLTITNVRIIGSTSTQAGGGGLALWTSVPGPAQVVITRSEISGNSAPNGAGGGIFIGPSVDVEIVDSTIDGNFAANNLDRGVGGGIYQAGDGIARANMLRISSSTISYNRAEGLSASGGGIYFGGKGRLTNSTLSGNFTTGTGGGAAARNTVGDLVLLNNVTIANNRGQVAGGGLWIDNASPASGSVAAYNSLIVGNLRLGDTIDNVIGSLSPVSASNLTSGDAAHLGPLADNGGLTRTHALLPGSPAIEAGDNTFIVGSFDQRGLPRVSDSADAGTTQTVDLGAYEALPTIEDIQNRSAQAGISQNVIFRVGDAAQASLSVAVSHSNPTLFPTGSSTLTRNADTVTLRLTPAAGMTGSSTVTVSVSALGQVATDTFVVTVTLPPDLSVVKSHAGSFYRGQNGAQYSMVVTNVGQNPTVGLVSLADILPTGLTATAMSGTGWSCVLATLNCTRVDALAAGASYPPVTLTVNVAADALPAVVNQAAVSGGGEINNANSVHSDVASIYPVPQITAQPTDQAVCAGQPVTFSASADAATYTSVRWQVRSGPSGSWVNAPGASSAPSYTFTASLSEFGSQYRAVFSNPATSTATNAALLTVNTAPAVTTQPESLTVVTVGQNVTLTSAATASPATTAQWQQAPAAGGPWTNIAGATTGQYSFTAAAEGTFYYRAAWSNLCSVSYSFPAEVVVNPLVRVFLPAVVR